MPTNGTLKPDGPALSIMVPCASAAASILKKRMVSTGKEQAQHKATREDLQKRLEQISAEANARTEELKSERDKVNSLLTRLESQENVLAAERQQHQATRETLQQRLEQTVADAQARAGELAQSVASPQGWNRRKKPPRSNWCEWAVK